MKYLSPLKTALLIAGTVTLSFATPEIAQADGLSSSNAKRWDMCRWEAIPENVLRRIERRADYDDILRRMFEYCPDSALGLTDRPTASVISDSGYGNGNRVNGRDEIGESDRRGRSGGKRGGKRGGKSGGTNNGPQGGGGSNSGSAEHGLPG